MSAERKFRDLKKSASDKKIAGVCGGFGEYTPLPSWMWRVVFLISLFLGGLGLISYIILWLCMPAADLAIRHERVINPGPSPENGFSRPNSRDSF
ncbi:MAG TPA: PspC domain-containing protein [Cellvibrio sp.]|nr:PspC domain-containing protein [Cellvibrio sp.]